ncbi:MAG: hypothetical protein ACI93P_002291 [bacterium]|jgi:hypothetical protein
MLRLLIPLLFLISCAEKSKPTDSVIESSAETPVWTKPEVEGHWKHVTTNEVSDIPFAKIYHDPDLIEPIVEGGPFEYHLFGDLVFENDTMYKVNFPIEIPFATQFSIDTGFINLSNGYNGSLPVQMVNDTLYTYTSGNLGSVYLKEGYVKTKFNDSIIELLKKHRVNYPELAGFWYLMRDYTYDYGTSYWLEYPHNIPDSIEVSRDFFINSQEGDKTIRMKTDGKNREYTYSYRSQYLHLTPGDWYQGEDPWIHFENVNNYNYIDER